MAWRGCWPHRDRRPASIDAASPAAISPWANAAFRRLIAVFVVNGIASAVPATLVLFFIRDKLALGAFEPLFLFSYFAAGALSMPLWVRAVPRFGLARLWLVGMLLAIAAFVWAATLSSGSLAGYLAVCVASGLALGADLALPSAMLAGVIQRAGHGGRSEGAYFGWWNFAIKLNLALAAGVALPLLAAFGYAPGARDDAALSSADPGLLPAAVCAQAVGGGAAVAVVDAIPARRTGTDAHEHTKTLSPPHLLLGAAAAGAWRVCQRADAGRLRRRITQARLAHLLQRPADGARPVHRPLGQGRAPLQP